MKSNMCQRVFIIVCFVTISLIILPTLGFSAKDNKLRIGWSEGPQAGMNPFLARNEGDYIFLSLMYEPLCIPLMTGEVLPWLAKKWEFNAGKNSWIFHLDKRAQWSDGHPLTAEDVKFTFDSAYKYDFPIGSTTKVFVRSVDVVDKYTVEFNMKQAFAAFLPNAGGTIIMPKHIWSKVGKIDTYKNSNPVGSGPFIYKKYQPRSHLYLVKNQNYWKRKIGVDAVIIKIFMNTEAAVVALKKGELDIMPDLSGNESLIPALMGDRHIRVVVDQWPHNLYIAPNHRIYPLNIKEFRQAIDMVVDKKSILKTALAGYGEAPLMGYVPPLVTKWANSKLVWKGINMQDKDRLAKANAILDGLGFKKGSDGIRTLKDGKKLELTIRCMTYPSYIRTSQMIKENLGQVGIKANVLVSDPQTLYGDIIYSGKKTKDWQMLVHGSTMNPDPDHFAREFAPDNPNPWDNATAFGYKNDKVQKLLRQSRREMNKQKRWNLIQKSQEFFAEDLAVITLGHRYHPAVYRTDKFKGWNAKPINYGAMLHPLGSIVNISNLSRK